MRKWPWVILVVLIALCGGVLWLLVGRQPVEEGRCRLVRKRADPSSPLVWLALQSLQPQTAKPSGVQDLPAGFDRPCYYLMKTGGKQVLLALNLSKEPRLCVDVRGDGVLSQEPCFSGSLVHEIDASFTVWRFGPIALAPGADSHEAAGAFYASCGGMGEPVPLTIRPAFLGTGKLKLDGRTYRAAVIDGDCDGQFGSILSLPLDEQWWLPQSDVFAIDLNHNGRFERSASLSVPSEVMPLGRLVRVADTYYALDIALDGTSLTLSKTQPHFGTLVVEPNDMTVKLRLWSDAADQCLHGRQWQLPAGKYQGTHAAFEKKDVAGNVWSFSCDLNSGSADYPLGPLKSFVIEPGQTTRLRLGPPLVVLAQVQNVGREVLLQPVLIGCGGERYQVGFQRNGQRVAEPAFRIVDEQGTVLVADKFRYG